jgi:hypothetical protein
MAATTLSTASRPGLLIATLASSTDGFLQRVFNFDIVS